MTAVQHHARSPSRSGGFTLLEVILAVTIFVLISGTLVGLGTATTSLVAELESTWTRHQQVNRFLELCRSTFRSLPPESRFLAKREETGPMIQQELEFTELHDWFAAGSAPVGQRIFLLQTRPRSGGGVEIVLITRETLQRSAQAPVEHSTILLPDLKQASWRFFNPANQQWLEVWTDSNSRPGMIELTLWPMEETAPTQWVFIMSPTTPQN